MHAVKKQQGRYRSGYLPLHIRIRPYKIVLGQHNDCLQHTSQRIAIAGSHGFNFYKFDERRNKKKNVQHETHND
jgi:hypothetical protein